MKIIRLAFPVGLALGLLALTLHFAQAGTAAVERSPLVAPQAVAPPWTIFTPVTNTLPMAANVITNSGFELTPLDQHGWSAYLSGYRVDEAGGHSGRALRLENAVATDSHGAYQHVTLNQTVAQPLYFSAWSKADSVSGITNTDYSLYIDVQYMDGTPLYGQVLLFDPGTPGWQFREGFIVPAKPIRSFSVYCLLRRSHSGTAWFDDVTVREVQADLTTFDSVQVATSAPAAGAWGGAPLSLTTGAGLALQLASAGGVISDVTLGGVSIRDLNHLYASGFFVRDVAGQSDYLPVGGQLTQTGNRLVQASVISPLALSFAAAYTATAEQINIHAVLANTRGDDRAVTLYFALPVLAEGWTWGDDIRTSRVVSGAAELANLGGLAWSYTVGATGRLSKYPWAALSGPAGGLALGVPLDQPRVVRLIHNPHTHQFYAAFDLGLSSLTTKFPNQASVDLVLYRFAGPGGFRAASQGYYDRFPAFFTRRIPPEREGLWVAFSDLAPISNLTDFGIAIHELSSLSQVGFDESADILSFRYVSEPWSHWLPITTTSVDVNSYAQVMAYLQERYQSGPNQHRAEATLSSGVFDDQGRYVYESNTQPWCGGVGGCALFTLNPDPDIADVTYPLNKAHLDWNATVQQAYTTTPGLDGEYIDSFPNAGSVLDFRPAHWAAADTPLTFRTSDQRVGMPVLFATTEFVRWLAQDVHGRGKLMMANGAALDMPWGVDLFDTTGQETDWLSPGDFVPQSDAQLSYRRTLSYQRPYGFLMNTNFDNFTYPLVERYFQICLFYGIYPSLFSHNAAEDRYWDDPALYNRDRPLFRRYIPVIQKLNTAGWQPVTYAQTSDARVYLERFGAWPELYFTLRNMYTGTLTVTVSVEAEALNLPTGPLRVTGLVAPMLSGLSSSGAGRSFAITLPPEASQAVVVEPTTLLYLPLVER